MQGLAGQYSLAQSWCALPTHLPGWRSRHIARVVHDHITQDIVVSSSSVTSICAAVLRGHLQELGLNKRVDCGRREAWRRERVEGESSVSVSTMSVKCDHRMYSRSSLRFKTVRVECSAIAAELDGRQTQSSRRNRLLISLEAALFFRELELRTEQAYEYALHHCHARSRRVVFAGPITGAANPPART